MKIILTIILLFICNITYGQVYEVDADVMYRWSNEQICAEDTSIVFGFKEDTICFKFLDQNVCYWSLEYSDFKKNGQYIKWLDNNTGPKGLKDEKLFLKKDWRNEVYLIRFLISEDGIMIYVSNVEYGSPVFVISSNKICLD